MQALAQRTQRFGVSIATAETTWVGHRVGQTNNYWEVGVGPRRPGVNSDGSWTWDSPIHGDSLDGWWPVREPHANASGAVRTDVNRPWWAIEIGNQSSYVINEARSHDYSTNLPGNRTFGVVGVWHSDPGNTGAGAGKGVGWTPLTLGDPSSTKSAWMGLRNHGDATVLDPITGQAFNCDPLYFGDFTNASAFVGNGSALRFPGYGSQMDQLMYRDIDVSSLGANNLTLTFDFATNMSVGKNFTANIRTGWFEGDPLSTSAGNFISAEAGSPANALAPVDSFQVYVGEPVEGTWTGSDGVVRPVYDNLRRWFNEVLNKNKRMWVFSADSVCNAQTKSIVIPNAAVNALKSSGNRLRLVFRVHTNRGFDDQGTAFNSGGNGAAQVDNVKLDLGAGAVTIGDFEGTTAANDIDNSPSLTAEQAWKSTGKPPATESHVHDLSSLTWADVCGPPGNIYRVCNMQGGVISAGNHDAGEMLGLPIVTPHSTEEAGMWGVVSPTVNLLTSGTNTPNGWDITGQTMSKVQDLLLSFDLYTGALDGFNTGCLADWAFQSYPSSQPLGGPAPGSPEWSSLISPVGLFIDDQKECVPFTISGRGQGLIHTSNASGIPDSVRVLLVALKTCYRFGVTTGCSATDGIYFDNVAIGLATGTTPAPMSVSGLDWFQDTFPVNEDVSLPGTVNFDTTAALMRTGRNISQTVGATALRFDVPGDSIPILAPADSQRIDLVFRIRPGVGNYVALGNATSGLRRVPTALAAVTAGDGSFWGTYEASPGEKAMTSAIALHASVTSGWNSLVWNSARCDTLEKNYFPVSGHALNPVVTGGGAWQSTLHESDPNFATLGTTKNRCFVVDTLGSLNDPNVRCDGVVPAWLSGLPGSYTGYDGVTTTKEYTSILPDGIFTPGTHVEYFLRREVLGGPNAGQVAMMPDTTTVYPQVGEGSLDGHRWQEFSVLPDRWKESAYGGGGAACMLVIDEGDGRGDELAWVSIADSIGLTRTFDRGAHNGWSARRDQSPNDPAAFKYKNGSAGSSWDLYGVKGGDGITTMAASIGARYAVRDASVANKVNGKYSFQAPTKAMLLAYYQIIFLMSGDLSDAILGPFTDRTQDDVRILQEFMAAATASNRRGVIVSGEGFAEAGFNSNPPFQAEIMDNQYFGMDLQYGWYRSASGNQARTTDLLPTASLVGTAQAGDIYGVRNTCTVKPDVLFLDVTDMPEVVAGAYYENVGASGPYVAVSYKPATFARPWVAIADGMGVQNVLSRFGDATNGRLPFYYNAFRNGLSSFTCSINCPDCASSLGIDPRSNPFSNFATLGNNPLVTGASTFRFGLAKADRASIRVYDVGGRLVRTLADRMFPAGEHSLTWDGVDDHGVQVARGVYFARVRYAGGFESAKRVIVLK